MKTSALDRIRQYSFPLYVLALVRCWGDQFGNMEEFKKIIKEGDLESMFLWTLTPEGFDFWNKVEAGEFPPKESIPIVSYPREILPFLKQTGAPKRRQCIKELAEKYKII